MQPAPQAGQFVTLIIWNQRRRISFDSIFFYLSLFSSIKSFTGTSAAAGGTAAGTAKTATAVGGTQLIVQNPKNLQQSTVSLQQIVRQQSNQIVLGKRIIPVSVSSQNARQTIQVNNWKFETGFKCDV